MLMLLCSVGVSAQYNPHDVLRQIRDSVDRDTMLTRQKSVPNTVLRYRPIVSGSKYRSL